MGLFNVLLETTAEVLASPITRSIDVLDTIMSTPEDEKFKNQVKRDHFKNSILRVVDPVVEPKNKKSAQTRKDEIVKPKVGDIIGVSRGLYDHIGVYIGRNQVIHFSSEDGDTSTNNEIIKTNLIRFLRDSKSYYIFQFPEQYGTPKKSKPILSSSFKSSQGTLEILDILMTLNERDKRKRYKLYSGTETAERAKSRLGEKDYSLIFKNCEHFAIWCKTGISESHQVNKIFKILKRNSNPIILY